MSGFGQNFGQQGPMVTPGQAQIPQNIITLIQNMFKGGSMTHPGQLQQPQNIQTPIEQHSPSPMSYFGNPDYQGHYGFPEKPTGLGGLRPLGGPTVDLSDYQGDPGETSLINQFGQDKYDSMFDELYKIKKSKKESDWASKNLNDVKKKWIADQAGLSHEDDIRNFISDVGGSYTADGFDKLINKYYEGGLDKFYQDFNEGKI